MEEYEDIINLPHHVSKRHPQMTMWNRAAQFAPFAALVGYDETIKESARKNEARYEEEHETFEDWNPSQISVLLFVFEPIYIHITVPALNVLLCKDTQHDTCKSTYRLGAEETVLHLG